MIRVFVQPSNRIYRGLHITHASVGGGPVPKLEASWRTVNGIVYAGRRRTYWVAFRRHSEF